MASNLSPLAEVAPASNLTYDPALAGTWQGGDEGFKTCLLVITWTQSHSNTPGRCSTRRSKQNAHAAWAAPRNTNLKGT
jgi:hypothetical protein